MSLRHPPSIHGDEVERVELREWLESLDYVIEQGGPARVTRLFRELQRRLAEFGVAVPYGASTPYLNTIPAHAQPRYPGNREIERRIKSIVRWNAMAMVVRANRNDHGLGGHISTYASAATLYEVAFNHFFRGADAPTGGDQIFFQGHASPGIYARAYLEGRLSETQLENFRRELHPQGGLASYPHPWLMPEFWQFPTVSMGLGPIMAIYQARFNHYLQDRGLRQNTGKVWAFLGDGETDEPEALGAISLAGRAHLDNLVFVVNCNLQRLDGPVRGNGKIIQELETVFRGAGWNVIKVIWGGTWDPLLEQDEEGVLGRRMEEAVDGDYQNYSVRPGAYIREHFFGTDPRLLKLVDHLSDEQLRSLGRGGHDPDKVYAAYAAAEAHKGQPTVILAKTIKGYGLGEAGEGKNITHQQKKLNEQELKQFRSRFGIPIPDKLVGEAPFYRPPDDSPEIQYLRERRMELGGSLPKRRVQAPPMSALAPSFYDEFEKGSDGREASTTMVFVRILAKLLRDKKVGPLVVPIVPDEARTFGMEALFRQVGIYSHVGQKYEPVDKETLLYYREVKDGQILEEGITEAGAMSSFIAAGTAYATHEIRTLPFFIFYSMFGFQRIGDLVWAAGDVRTRGFMLGATAGRTTLNGEGLQHQDGHSHLLAYPCPNVLAYDPAWAYELAVLIQEGIERMHVRNEDVFYYLTLCNEAYAMPVMPEGVREGILRGLYRFRATAHPERARRVQLWGSGPLLKDALAAADTLESRYDCGVDVWSVTSYQQLYRDALDAERQSRLRLEEPAVAPYVSSCMEGAPGPIVAVSDYTKALPHSLARWVRAPFVALGTDGFGRSETRAALREHFEVDANHVVLAALGELAREGKLDVAQVVAARAEMGIDPGKANPLHA